MTKKKISYSSAGVNIDNADATKRGMAESLRTENPLVLNSIGAFASLCDGSFPGYKNPVLVCKTEEPGSKQLLAFQYGYQTSICYDLINHLINDVIVMGARPMFVQDLIVCGKLEGEVIKGLVRDIAAACKAQDCVLTGGETSEQPAVLAPGTYVLGASCIGVAEKSRIIDGSTIKPGDIVLGLESSGVHTNGYTLIRALIKEDPSILKADVGGRTFLDAVMEPHRCYWKSLQGIMQHPGLHGMAHITGGGIPGNLNRILPKSLDANIDFSSISVLPIFSYIRERSQNDDADMIKTFNLGVGATLVVSPDAAEDLAKHIEKSGVGTKTIGSIVDGGSGMVRTSGSLTW